MKAMIFAAGLGTRLKPLTDHCPKALVKINNKTLLEHCIRYLQQFNIYDVIVNVHHFADDIENTVKDNSGFGSRVCISDERTQVLETGGGLKNAATFLAGETAFILINVDILTNLDLSKMILAHTTSGGIGTIAVMKRSSSRHFLFDEQMCLVGWENNSTSEVRISRDTIPRYPFAFSGISILSGAVFQDIPFSGKFSLVDLYLHLAVHHTLYGFDHTGNIFIDVGKPENITKAEYLFGTVN